MAEYSDHLLGCLDTDHTGQRRSLGLYGQRNLTAAPAAQQRGGRLAPDHRLNLSGKATKQGHPSTCSDNVSSSPSRIVSPRGFLMR